MPYLADTTATDAREGSRAMAKPPTRLSTLTRLNLWFRRYFPHPRMRLWLALLVVGSAAFFTRDKITVPFTVGWRAAEVLVEKEEQVERVQRETEEYKAAAAFFQTDEGRDYAQKLLYDQLKPGEQRIPVKPETELYRPGGAGHLGGWVQRKEERLETSWEHTRKVLRRCFVDPPQSLDPQAEAKKAGPKRRPAAN